MCGIAGMLISDGLGADDLVELDQLGELMARRGPDDSGAWNDEVCGLTFRRLSIIDLTEGGHQPMVSDDGRDVVVFNGEIYNFAELRQQLQSMGRTFRSRSDTEVVLQSLAEWGRSAFSKFNGMFAIGWYNTASRRLVLARDPMGIKPLHWWSSPHAFVFGSQYDQVVRHRRCQREDIDPVALHIYLRLGYLPLDRGLIRSTGQVEAGHLMIVEPGSTPRVERFRTAPTPVPRGERLFDREADEAVASAVDSAVARQTVSDVQMGCFISGGVDSPLVAAAMQTSSETRVPAFTIGTDDPASDETAPAGEYADVLGLDHHVRTITGAGALEMLDDVASANTEPFGDFSSFPTLLVSEFAAEHVKTVQSGDGGDELFWGYPRFAKVREARRWFSLPRPARVAAYGASKPLSAARRPARGIMFDSIGDWYLDAHSGLRERDFSRIVPDLAPLPEDFDLFSLDGDIDDDGLMQWMRMNELRCHLPMVLQKVDRAAMFHSLEVRVPLLDLDLVDLAFRVDPSACLNSEAGKLVLRNALSQHVPADRIPVPKRGFTVPMRKWLSDDLGAVVNDLLVDRDPFPHGYFNRVAMKEFYADHMSGRLDLSRGLWNLLALQLWAQTHLRPLGKA
ncbi:MAG: asparagine synthase (glutamine-hydrolyzing) [Microthrixaceae bacterium]